MLAGSMRAAGREGASALARRVLRPTAGAGAQPTQPPPAAARGGAAGGRAAGGAAGYSRGAGAACPRAAALQIARAQS
jgi:hypothetical protein